MRRFEGKVVIVTGSGGGIGRATALAFAQEGAKVTLGDVAGLGNQETLAQIEKEDGEAIAVDLDVRDEASVKEMVDLTVRRHGGLDVAVNNAGIFQPLKPLHEQNDSTFQEVINVNLRGVWLCMRYQIPPMLAKKNGAIVNISSIASITGSPGSAFYTASKHGVLGLTRGASVEYASSGIRINAVGPGVTRTPMFEQSLGINAGIMNAAIDATPIHRIADASEMARVILFIASDEASFIVGQNLIVDGGLTVI